MRGIRRLVLLVAVTTVAFAFAVVRFESAAEEGCAQRARTDPSYRVHLARTGDRPPTTGMAGMGGMGGMDAGGAGGAGGAGSTDGMDMGPTGPVTYRVRVVHGGRPVAGADVCIAAYMRGMSAMAVVGHADETSAGTYEVTLDFAMGGEWTARVVVDEPRHRAVAVPLDLVAG